MQKNEVKPLSYPNNSEWINELIARPMATKLPEKTEGKNIVTWDLALIS